MAKYHYVEIKAPDRQKLAETLTQISEINNFEVVSVEQDRSDFDEYHIIFKEVES